MTNKLSTKLSDFRKVKMSPPLFLLLLLVIFAAPSVVIASSGGKIAPPQLPEHSFPIMRR